MLLQLLSFLVLNSNLFNALVVLIGIRLWVTFFRAVNIAQDRFLPKWVRIVEHGICDILNRVMFTGHPNIWGDFIEAAILNRRLAQAIRLFIYAHVGILNCHVTDLYLFRHHWCVLSHYRFFILKSLTLIILVVLVINRYLQVILFDIFMVINIVLVFSFGKSVILFGSP